MTNDYTLVGERNYAAESVFIDENKITYFDKLDNLVVYEWAGYTFLIPHSMIGRYAVMFPAECQLSEFVAQDNNLYAKQEMNSDPTIKGYLGKNRRVKAIKLRGVNSNALALPAAFFGYPPVGTVFDTQNGHEICRKYVIPHKEQTNAGNKYKKLWRRVDDKFLPEHYDTGQFWRESDKFNANDHVVITQKLHGCFRSSTLVRMWDGANKKITEIKAGDVVVGYRDGVAVPSTVTCDAFTTGKTDVWQKLKFSRHGKGDKPTTFSTPDHRFLTPKGYVRADELQEGDTVFFVRTEPLINKNKLSVLTGLMLGDGSRGPRKKSVEWSHKVDHLKYLELVRDQLGNIAGTGNFQHRTSGYGTHMVGARTQELDVVGDFLEGWKDGVPQNLRFDPLTLAIWYMDDGSLGHHPSQQDRANFATCSFTDSDVGVVTRALNEYGFDNFTFYQSRNKDDGPAYWRLRLNYKDAEKLFEDIAIYIPECMQYKLPAYFRGRFNPPPVIDETQVKVREVSVIHSSQVSAKKLKYATKWDIETETGNFVAQGIVVHNSSVRLSNTYVKRKLRWRDKIARWFGVETKEFDFDYIGGSRKVIKDPNNPLLQQDHYYSSDIWSEAATKYGPLLPKGVVVYGELIGYVTGTSTPIQTGYTYNVPVGETELYVYRVAVVQEDGGLYDLSWPGVKEFCKERGLKWVPELWSGEARYVVPDRWTNRNFNENPEPGFPDTPVPLCNESPCDEGVVVRRDGVIPFALKIKSPNFLIHETKQLDKAEKTGEEIME